MEFWLLSAALGLSWESPLTILRYPDPRLRAINSTIGVFDERLQQLAKEMFDIMYEYASETFSIKLQIVYFWYVPRSWAQYFDCCDQIA